MQRERTPRQDELETKFMLLSRLPFDQRMRRPHILIYGFILDWYHRKYGDALASVRHIGAELKRRDPERHGLGTRHIHGALTDLVSWGYLDQEKGKGKRASRYIPIWAGPQLCVPPGGNASSTRISVPPVGNTPVPPGGNANGSSVPPVGNEDPSTPTRVQDPGTGLIDTDDCAAPLALPAPALAAGPAETAQGGFDELYAAYGVRRRKLESRAAYDKLAADDELHTRMVAAATAWRASAGDVHRMHLQRWIEGEHYDEDPPAAYEPKERKVKQRSPSSAAAAPAPLRTPPVDRIVTIVDSEIVPGIMGDVAHFALVDEASEPAGEIEIFVESKVASIQEKGQTRLRSLMGAVGLAQADDSNDFHHRPFLLLADGSFEPLPVREAA